MTQPTQMNAAVLGAAGSPFRITQVARPTPKAGEVLLRIKASGVNPLDLKIRAGAAAHAQQPLPAILGIDMAGTIEAIGADVRGFATGDDVFGMTGGVGGVQGSLAEFAAVDARLIAHKPVKLSHREAAALPLIFITAWEGLVDRAHVKAGQKVLIQGGGGVGHIVVQQARAFGATAFAVDSAAKHDFLTGHDRSAVLPHVATILNGYKEPPAGFKLADAQFTVAMWFRASTDADTVNYGAHSDVERLPVVEGVVPEVSSRPRVSSSIRSGAPVAVAATTARSASATASRSSRRRACLTALNMWPVAWRTATKSGCSRSNS